MQITIKRACHKFVISYDNYRYEHKNVIFSPDALNISIIALSDIVKNFAIIMNGRSHFSDDWDKIFQNILISNIQVINHE